MKIRSDFVTNSSSSSFVCMNIKSSMLEKFITDLNKKEGSEYTISMLSDMVFEEAPYDIKLNDLMKVGDVSSPSEVVLNFLKDNVKFAKLDLEEFDIDPDQDDILFEEDEEYDEEDEEYDEEDEYEECSPSYLLKKVYLLQKICDYISENKDDFNKTAEVLIEAGTSEEGGGSGHYGETAYYAKKGHGKYYKIEGCYEDWDNLTEKENDMFMDTWKNGELETNIDNTNPEYIDFLKKHGTYKEF